ncbi:MAG: hypothetical protein ABL886_13150 [Rhodoglobus sp.]
MTSALELAVLGVLMLLVALAQYSMKDYFGEKVASNLTRAGSPRLASKWTKKRGERVSTIGAVIFVALGTLLLGLAGLLAFVS